LTGGKKSTIKKLKIAQVTYNTEDTANVLEEK
jgi:hypothetical protein